ncbi:MAG: LmeA family phospholipid-binding protein [Cyanobacteria bacterium]|nr:LmeA family phospholipid-binding protein [Cyanobacteriota bacterium]
MSDPLLQLISAALRLWIRSRCEHIGALELNLHGSSFGLLRGRLTGASLQARNVLFDGLPLQVAELSSGPIQVDLKLLQPGRMLAVHDPFQITGTVTMSGQELSDALVSARWRGLGDWMAERLMGLTPLRRLEIHNDVLELQASVVGHRDPIRRRFQLRAEQGTVVFFNEGDGVDATPLPMDPSIRITNARLGSGLICLQGHATVTP